ncbi:AMP-binding protein [Chloroflexota bacterium]
MAGYLDKPWLKSYKMGPYKLDHSLAPYPQKPVFAALDEAATNHPGQTAIQFSGRTIRYRQLKSLVDKLSAGLAKLGVSKGDRVCIFLPNCTEFIISDWAILKTGAVVVPTSVLRSDEGLLHEVGSSKCNVIICREEHLEQILAVKESCNIEHIIVTSTDGYDIQKISTTLPKGVYEFRALIEENDPTPPIVEINPTQDLCELAFTGGATGIPKGVMVTHANRYSCILQGFPWMLKSVLRGLAGKSSMLIPIPLFHSLGHYLHQSAANLGLRVILLPDPRDTDHLVEQMLKYRPLLIPAVPTQLMRVAEANLSRMNVLTLSGSAPLPQEVSETIKKKTGMPVSEGYGLTETSPVTHFNVSAFSRITGFMAKDKFGIGVPTPDTECKLVDPESGTEVPFGEKGEILVKGPQIMKGYWPEPGSGLTDDGWLHTGDIAVMDEDGYFQIVDRIKDMVNISGLKVYTTEVDEVLFRHPDVLMAASYGVPDPKIPGSERVMATIRLKEGAEVRTSREDIRNFCRENLPPYAVPRFVEFRDEMPLTVTEKVFKKSLREEAIARMKEQEKR